MKRPSSREQSDGRGERPASTRPDDMPAVEGEALVAHLVERIAQSDRAARSHQAARQLAEERQACAASAARHLAGRPDTPIGDLVRHALPTLGEWCIVEEGGPSGARRTIVAVNASLEGDGGAGIEAHLQVPRITVKAEARGRVVATLTFGRDAEDRDYESADRRLAEEIGSYVGIAVEHRRIAATAEAAARAKSEFLTMMSHELRTPLNAIAGYAQLLEMGFRGPLNDAQRDAVGRILRGQEHLLELVDAVLTFTRLTGGGLSLDSTTIASTELLHRASEDLVVQFAERGIDFRVECASQALVRADLERASEVLRHLLANALKFTPAGGRVTLSCEEDVRAMRFVVADTGRGIPASQQEQVFQPFVQVERGLTRSVDGSGLGLAVGRELATRMGGSLTMTSEVGRGSRFVFTLARVDPEAEAGSIDSIPREG